MIGYLEAMHETAAWKQVVEENGWTDDFKTGDEFDRVHRGAGRTGLGDPRGAGTAMADEKLAHRHGRSTRRSYGLAAVLALVGIYTIIDARGLNVGFGDPVGPRVFPLRHRHPRWSCSPCCSRVATARGDVPEGEEGEDIDLTTPPDWLTVGKLVAILVLNILLVNVLGWAVTGACSSPAARGRSAAAPCCATCSWAWSSR